MVVTVWTSAVNSPMRGAPMRWRWVLAGLLCIAACGSDDDAPLPAPTATATASSTATAAVVSTATASTATAAPSVAATATQPVVVGSPTRTAPPANTPTQPINSPTPVASAVRTPTPRPSTATPQPECSITPGALPFDRTECRPTCAHFDPLKQVFFGETHLHTAYSFDASTIDTRNLPPDAYRYAKGGAVGLPPWADTRGDTSTPGSSSPSTVTEFPYCMPGEECQFSATRIAQLPPGRALDFAAITDHSEQFGENNICLFLGTQECTSDADCTEPNQFCDSGLSGGQGLCVPTGYNATVCRDARQELSRIRSGPVAGIVAALENVAQNPSRPPGVCGPDGSNCLANAQLVWQQIIDAAQASYDRTESCTFTSFIAYEYTAMAANGRCSADLLPCWDAMGTAEASVDCAGFDDPTVTTKQTCDTDFLGSQGGDNLHRNIIFRNDDVIDLPLSNVEEPLACGEGTECESPGQVASPKGMLSALREECLENPSHPRCDVLSIPHNSNMSRGAMFLLPEDLETARLRRDLEPLVELMQIKGQSECRYSPVTGTYWSQDPNAPDELCDFENMGFSRLNGLYLPAAQQSTDWLPPRAYVRETLKDGIAFEAANGINPFQVGFVGGLDNHNGTPGQSEEIDYAARGGHAIASFVASAQALNEKFFLGFETNGGALTGVWAEENSRDSIFTAMKNRETFATSGTRPVVRVFGGYDLPPDMCASGTNFAQAGYDGGVPMGGCLSAEIDDSGRCRAGGDAAPSFAVLAMMDPGWPGHDGTPLQRIQIVKGWVDAAGETHDAVYDVAGDADNGADVDLATCTPQGPGAPTLCAQWTDPDFDPDQHAFYYARVLENPSCRWNQHYCNARGVDCELPMGACSSEEPAVNGRGCDTSDDCGSGGVCTAPLSYTQFEYQQCCGDIVPKTVQQRAWSSPIWFSPRASEL